MGMVTAVVFQKDTREVLAVIPINGGKDGICRKDVGFQIFNDAEPVFMETPNGIALKENTFIIRMGG